MINIIIVDDSVGFRSNICSTIKAYHSDIAIVGEAASGAEFFALLQRATADIVLLDIRLPDTNGIDIARRLKQEYPEMKILAVSADNSMTTIEEMLLIGIEGFVSKFQSNPETIIEAVRSIINGTEYFGKDISDIIRRIYVAIKKTTRVTSEFTDKEKRVIELCQEGLSGKEISEVLNISLRTVDNHKNHIFRKLGIKSTRELVRYAVKNGIIKMK